MGSDLPFAAQSTKVRYGPFASIYIVGGEPTLVSTAANGGLEPKAAPEPITFTTPKAEVFLCFEHQGGDARWLSA